MRFGFLVYLLIFLLEHVKLDTNAYHLGRLHKKSSLSGKIQNDDKLVQLHFSRQNTEGMHDYLAQAKSLGWDIGVATMQNRNRGHQNQDNFIFRLYETLDSDGLGIGLFGVLDGHGRHGHIISADAANEVMKEADRLLTRFPESYDFNPRNEAEAMITSFLVSKFDLELDPRGSDLKIIVHLLYSRANEAISQKFYGGSTMSLVLIDLKSDRVYVASAGDSIVMGKTKASDSSLDCISSVHSMTARLERQRVKKAFNRFGLVLGKKEVHTYSEVAKTYSRSKTTVKIQFKHSYALIQSNLSAQKKMALKLPFDAEEYPYSLNSHVSPAVIHAVLASKITTPNILKTSKKLQYAEEKHEYLGIYDNYFSLPLSCDGIRQIPGHMKGEGHISYGLVNRKGFPSWDIRLGPLQPSRSLGDGGRKVAISSTSFVRHDPEIKEYKLSEFDFIVLSSDGYTNRYEKAAYTETYLNKIHKCSSGDCLKDPLEKFNAWVEETSLSVENDFANALEELNDATWKLAAEHMFSHLKAASDMAPTNMSLAMDKAIELSSHVKLRDDDITLLVSESKLI